MSLATARQAGYQTIALAAALVDVHASATLLRRQEVAGVQRNEAIITTALAEARAVAGGTRLSMNAPMRDVSAPTAIRASRRADSAPRRDADRLLGPEPPRCG